ncbi:PD-(D/E)XK nuclease family protein [Sphingomonas montana]|uniref:PD-(D/E)XK nuclease family protein n=1 Tax=Sphingomonas montana TaxID=1843236 RepID=UPI00096EF93D|nr:PD-(D/E)XK nuclease family protein [Sphingomonas montana]
MIEELTADIAKGRATRGSVRRAFNPIDLLATRETAQSRILAWLLDPRGTHGVGTAFLDGFLHLLGVACASVQRFRPQLEAPVTGGGRAGRVDILLQHPEWTIAIENKPTAGFRDRQLEGYAAAIAGLTPSSMVVVLLGAGWSEAFAARIRAQPGMRCLLLGVEVQQWVVECTAIAPAGPVRDFIADFGRYLKTNFGDGVDDDMQNDLNIMLASRESVAATIRVLEAQDGFAAGVSRRFEAIVAGRCIGHGLALRPAHDENPLFSPHKGGMLRIDIGNPDYDFSLSADYPMFEGVCFGLCMRKVATLNSRTYKALIAGLNEQLRYSEPAGEWWPWWLHVEELDTSGARIADAASRWEWAMDESDDGLAAVLVERARQVRELLKVPANS